MVKSSEFLVDFKNKGYTYVIMPKRKKKTFYALKTVMNKYNNFDDNADVFEFVLTDNEEWDLPRGVFISL